MIKILLCSALAICSTAAVADDGRTADTLSVEVYYRQGAHRPDSAYMAGREQLDSLLSTLHALTADTSFRLDRFRVVSGASPEGSTSFNKALSKKRTLYVGNYLRAHLPASQSAALAEESLGVDWEGLRAKVKQSAMPYKEEVLRILEHSPEWIVRGGVVVDGRKRQLMNLHRGTCWRYMEREFFPGLRRSRVTVEYSSVPRLAEPEKTVETADSADVVCPVYDQAEDEPQDSTIVLTVQPLPLPPIHIAVKTNLLFDALLVPNAGLEFYLGKGFSVGANWMYAWWKTDRRHRYWRLYGGELDVRKYFGRPEGANPLSGHHVGLYGQIFTFDFETGGRGYIGGKPGCTLWEKMNYAAGVEYGYSLPVARRLNLDFAIGAGYWGGDYYEYEPVDNHYVWRQTKQRHWFGPTKAEVSLVWLIGRGNHNEKKGGKP